MSKRFEAAIQLGKGIYQLGKTVAKKLKGNKQKTTGGGAIKSVRPGTNLTFKRGTCLRRPSNVEKIKKAFGPKQKPQTRMTGKKKKFPDLTGDGKVTFADILKGRGVINGKKKKKVI